MENRFSFFSVKRSELFSHHVVDYNWDPPVLGPPVQEGLLLDLSQGACWAFPVAYPASAFSPVLPSANDRVEAAHVQASYTP